ncbi:hypothetical protein AV654_19515 [Paenibacillus elgii]|uniref:Actin-like protein N-terminal domain-containing protein n=1 Tax=Paenibacillus elgii TaxID=189691 RepID=A0A163XN63_9BACL|nr:ParM/StbA family protein [Paenibacillus elgii]KZE78166.1 hypothetical protein AV654_19515 [Paenibacillus elgii]
MAKAIQLKMGNDIGNSAHKFKFNGNFVIKKRRNKEYRVNQPSCNLKIERTDIDNDVDEEQIVKGIWENLIIRVESPAIKLPGYYMIGRSALDSGKSVDNLMVGVDAKAYHDLPVINTLGNIAAYIIDTQHKDGKLTQNSFKVVVDMTASIPVTQYKDGTPARHLEQRFMNGEHEVTVFLGKREVKITIVFEFVYVTHEGSPSVFAIQYNDAGEWRNDDIYRLINERRAKKNLPPVIGEDFQDLKILHVAIGDGTTELTITHGIVPKYKYGINHGIGHALEECLQDVMDAINVPDSPRQYISKVLQEGVTHKYYNKVINVMKTPLKREIDHIKRGVIDQMVVSRGEVDVILVYGGGSITCYPEMAQALEPICEERECELFYVPSEYAVDIEAEGLYLFLSSPIYAKTKAKYLEAATSK